MSIIQTKILQFGTSRFLQAHADLFFSEADPAWTITVVQSSGDASRAHRLKALATEEGFPVRVRGIENGAQVDVEKHVTSVKQCFSTATDWESICEVAVGVDYILSNTSDRGYDPQPADEAAEFDNAMSFPAKLTHLLAHRFKANKAAPVLLPTELIPDNGDVLKARVQEIAKTVFNSAEFDAWLSSMPSANSIVDRIVSEPIEPAGAVAEPYALWAVQKAEGISAPCDHPCVQLVDDLEVSERLKLHILNLGHTYIADLWRSEGWAEDMTVLDFMSSDHVAKLHEIYAQEVTPVFAKMNLEAEAEAYITTTLERFANPFLAHRIADIAQNHEQKIERRIAALYAWAEVDVATVAPTLSRITATSA